jgi:AraC-like DNA-binding protein
VGGTAALAFALRVASEPVRRRLLTIVAGLAGALVVVSLAELARIAGLPRFQILRAFARETGLTPHAYQVQRRIDLVRRLITRRVPLAEAALTAGFADQSHMTRAFVRRYGLTPAAYRSVRLQ